MFERGPSATGQPHPVGWSAVERVGAFFPPPANGIDVQTSDQGDEAIAAVADAGAFDGGVPTALLLIEPVEKQVHLPVDNLLAIRLRAKSLSQKGNKRVSNDVVMG